ncbi:hypothetical protein [Prosthecobacter vanneervenii]|uniref:Uncharacterized protein n=1 Tax=Prosthecobacter vanneervenii TaxID=48466 RepID=A0A7W7YFQ3_9BACT|nr:hypothetical protein [Prosthecobacter vanneervenii]MBB5035350.1 hypothetical protein [Prosthecobacter vanneervenii]
MSGPIFNTNPIFAFSDNKSLLLKMEFVPPVSAVTNGVRPIKEAAFSLEEKQSGQVLWKRQFGRGIFARALFISDNGWSVLHLGRDHPRLHVINPAGEEVLIVAIEHALCSRPMRPALWKGPWEVWSDKHVMITSVGTFWTIGARIRFEQIGSQTFFICRTRSGRYLVLDLNGARLLSEVELPPELVPLLRPSDQCWALDILTQVSRERAALECAIECADGGSLSPPDMDDLYSNFEIALRILRQDNVKKAAEVLKELQDFRGPVYQRGVYPALEMNGGEWQYDPAREWIHLTMFVTGVKPRGLACRWFCETDIGTGARFRELPECIPDRDRILKSLKPGMTFDAVISRVGAPSALLRHSELEDELPFEEQAQYERWDYDELGVDGKPHSWGLIFRLSNVESVQQDPSKPWSHSFRFKTTEECTPVLHAVKRIRWTKAYREIREGRY